MVTAAKVAGQWRRNWSHLPRYPIQSISSSAGLPLRGPERLRAWRSCNSLLPRPGLRSLAQRFGVPAPATDATSAPLRRLAAQLTLPQPKRGPWRDGRGQAKPQAGRAENQRAKRRTPASKATLGAKPRFRAVVISAVNAAGSPGRVLPENPMVAPEPSARARVSAACRTELPRAAAVEYPARGGRLQPRSEAGERRCFGTVDGRSTDRSAGRAAQSPAGTPRSREDCRRCGRTRSPGRRPTRQPSSRLPHGT